MMEGDTVHWRSYFRKAGVDIWSVIQHAIYVAAIEFPKDFKSKRGEIAETLFARELVRLNPNHVELGTACISEEANVRQSVRQVVETRNEADPGDDNLRRRCMRHDGAEDLTNEPRKEHLSLEEVNIIKETCIGADQPEVIVYEALHKLKHMNITVPVLEATEIGKKVKGLRKHPSCRVGTLAKELVSSWKRMVIEWMDAAEEATAGITGATAGTGRFSESGETSKQEGLLSLFDKDALVETRASSVELSQLFSFLDEDICGQRFEGEMPVGFLEPTPKDNPNQRSLSQSGSMLTDSSDFNVGAQKWGLKMTGERGTVICDRMELLEKDSHLSGQEALRGRTNQVKFTPRTEISPGNSISVSSSSLLHKKVATHPKNSSCATMRLDKNLACQKLEIARRKLHKGYAEAENAKRQRTVQVLDILDLPKSRQAVQTRVDSSGQNKKEHF